jgi:hypothetical protein
MDWDPDSASKINADPCEFGSTPGIFLFYIPPQPLDQEHVAREPGHLAAHAGDLCQRHRDRPHHHVGEDQLQPGLLEDHRGDGVGLQRPPGEVFSCIREICIRQYHIRFSRNF